jgi:hypothetical protein
MIYNIRVVVLEGLPEQHGRIVGDYIIAVMRGPEPPTYEELQAVFAAVLVADKEEVSQTLN